MCEEEDDARLKRLGAAVIVYRQCRTYRYACERVEDEGGRAAWVAKHRTSNSNFVVVVVYIEQVLAQKRLKRTLEYSSGSICKVR